MAAAKIKLWLLLEAKIECCAGLRTLIMPKATEGQSLLWPTCIIMSLRWMQGSFLRLVPGFIYLALRLNCAAPTNPWVHILLTSEYLFTIKFARTWRQMKIDHSFCSVHLWIFQCFGGRGRSPGQPLGLEIIPSSGLNLIFDVNFKSCFFFYKLPTCVQSGQGEFLVL